MQLIFRFLLYAVTLSSVILFFYAVRTGKYKWAFLSAAFSIPICLFMGGYPSMHYIPVLFPLGVLMGAICIKKGRTRSALVFFAPYMVLWVGTFITILVNI
jgi:hypothetical protein